MYIIFIISQCITYPLFIIFTSLAINGNVKLWKLRQQMFIQKRAPKLHFGLNITLIISFFLLLLSYTATTHFDSRLAYAAPRFLLYTIIFIFLFFCVTKSWMIYYREKWTFYTLELEWQQIINDTALTNNWWITNNKKWGNLTYIYKLFGLYHLIEMFIIFIFAFGTLIEIIPPPITFPVLIIPILFDTCFYARLICKTNRSAAHNDIFFIHWESVQQSKLMLVAVIAYIMFLLLSAVLNDYQLTNSIFTPICMSLFYVIHHVSTYSILKQNILNHEHSDAEISISSASFAQLQLETTSITIDSKDNTDEKMKKDKNYTNITTKKPKKLKIRQILQSKEAIHMFLIHLSREWSMECLLSFVEFTQFIAYAFSECDLVKEQLNVSRFRLINFPSNIPMSSIIEHVKKENIEHNDIQRDLKIIAHKLYNKYICEGTEFEINVKYNHRKKCKEILGDLSFLLDNKGINMCDLITVIQNVRQEMVILLGYSLARFRSTKEYNTLLNNTNS